LDALQKALDETVEHGTAGDILPSIPYTQNFKEVLNSGSAEAVKLDHDYLGTEHILLGILRSDSSLASTLLKAQGLNLESVRQAVRQVLKCGGAEEPRRLADKP
jgi:ATP-dependent Clp protease ATP-binding subunit ClpC